MQTRDGHVFLPAFLKALAGVAVCATVLFGGSVGVHAQSEVYLPAVSLRDLTCAMPPAAPADLPSGESHPSFAPHAVESDRILPIGMYLDDVGQYYSQVAPSLSSTVVVSGTAAESQIYSLHLYGDTGYRIRAIHACNLASGTRHEWTVVDGALAVRTVDASGTRDVTVTDICRDVTEGRDEFGRTEPSLHGLYHARIEGDDRARFDVRVHTVTDEAHPELRTHTQASYWPVTADDAGSSVYLPGVLATRDSSNFWDTEIIVQNVLDTPSNIVIEVCEDDGQCYRNNRARLGPYERRVFLASHLLYKPTSSGLAEQSGWYAAVVRATPEDESGDKAKVAVIASVFRQNVEANRIRPSAEYGSLCLYTATPPAPSESIEYLAGVLGTTYIRLHNPLNTTADVRVSALVQPGAPPIVQRLKLGPRETQTVAIPIEDSQSNSPSNEYDTLDRIGVSRAGVRDIRVSASSPIVAFVWDESGPVHARRTIGHSVWYAPLIGAPVLPFRWDSERFADDHLVPSTDFGLSETRPTVHALRPDWARRLNWYDAGYRSIGYDRSFCNEPYDSGTPVSFYIPLWRRLGPCGATDSHDRTCLNTDERFRRLRNSLPSSCAGRPLFIANEPDLSSQGFMTYHELGRLIYVLRDWPGQLFSPAFASFSYERPTLPPEQDPLCREYAAESACPGQEGCELCVRDGVFDGQLDPFDISLMGLEGYFGEEGRWAQGQSWKLEDTIEGMLLHFYNGHGDTLNDGHWRIPYLEQYQRRAAEAGWPIVVKEYGFAVWPDEFGKESGYTASSVAAQVDDIRQFLQRHLGKVDDGPGRVKKLFWYQTGCVSQSDFWSLLCLFSDPSVATEPVGRCWYKDAITNDQNSWDCGLGAE